MAGECLEEVKGAIAIISYYCCGSLTSMPQATWICPSRESVMLDSTRISSSKRSMSNSPGLEPFRSAQEMEGTGPHALSTQTQPRYTALSHASISAKAIAQLAGGKACLYQYVQCLYLCAAPGDLPWSSKDGIWAVTQAGCTFTQPSLKHGNSPGGEERATRTGISSPAFPQLPHPS